MAKQNKGRKFFAASATAALVASAIVPVASAAQVNDYNKISGYAKEAVQSLVDAGVIQGDTNGNFNPLNTVTRAQAAEIFTKALELEADGDVNFSDVKKGAWYYNSIAAVVANGIFEGVSAKEFAPNKSLTRSEAAKVLVDAFGLEGSESLSQFADASQVKPWAKDALETAVANGIFTGSEENGKLNLKPNAAITRQDFAVVFARTLELVDTEAPVDATVKAINNTTVEVTFDEKVGNLDELKFEIDGLEIKNKAHKQSNDKVVVLTTAAQEAGKEYTVTLGGEKIGSFKGVEAVIPTAIDIVEKSQQEVVGNQVTVKAKVTVAEGQSKVGIPVTFNIVNSYADNSTGSLNQPIVAEVTTDAEGVATYSYTRYAQTSQQIASSDEVQAYATGKASLRSFSKVYWASIKPLTITSLTEGNSVNNGAKKQYKIKAALYHTEGYSSAFTENGQVYPAGNYVNIAYKENVDVTPDKAIKTVDVIDAYGKNLGYPAQFTTSLGDQNQGIKVVKIPVDKNGEAIVTLTGSNADVTPIVFVDNKENPQNATGNRGRFNATELFAEAPKLSFGKIQNLRLTVDSIGTEYAAAYIGSLNANVSTFTYENAAGDRLYRDAAGNLAILANGATLPTGTNFISQANPLRAGEIVPAGFTQKFINANVTVPAFNSLFSATKSVHTYYNIAGGKSASAQLADALVNTGGRDYKAVLKDEKGNLAPTGTQVRVSVEIGSGVKTNSGPVYLVDKNSNSIHRLTTNAYDADKVVVNLATDAKGEVAFTLIGAKDAYATPTVFSETGDKAGLDKNDLQQVGSIAFFGDAIVKSATLTVDGKDEKSVTVGDLAAFTYQTVDQNNKPYNTYNQSNLRVTFQFTSTFAGAEVYAAKDVVDGKLVAGAKPIGYVNMGSANTSPFPVDAVDGKATVYVKATRGTTVTATASANTPSLPQNLSASAVFNLSNNEGVQPGVPVTGKVIATDLTNNRLLLLLSDGVTVRDVDYSGTNTQFFIQGSRNSVSELTFEDATKNNVAGVNNLLGKEVTFTLAKDSTPTKVENSGIGSAIQFKDGAKIHLTNANAVYNFEAPGVAQSPVGSATEKVDIYVNADNITIKNANVTGSITVGGQGSTPNDQDQKTVRTFTADNVKLNGNAFVYTASKNTFNLLNNSNFDRVILENAEKVNLSTATIGELVLKANNAEIVGSGTINAITTLGSVVAPAVPGTIAAPSATAETVAKVVTTSADTVTFTFATGSNLLDGDITVLDGSTAGAVTTSGDTAAVKFAAPVAGKTLYVKVLKNGVTKEYTVVVNSTIGAEGTVTRKY